jgi:molybdate transport system permease protein
VSTRSRLFEGGLLLASTVALAFLVLPLLAIFLRVPPGELFAQLGSDVAVDALVVTAKTNAIAMALLLFFGTPTAYFLATRRFRGRALLVTLVELPLVLPPAVAGIGLLAAFGARGLLGETLDVLGLELSFTQAAVVLAVTFVASPFYVRQAIASFQAVDQTLVDASRTLGATPAKTFVRIALPLAGGGLATGLALAFARGIGEFGATIMFAGSLQGLTQTLPLAIYAELDQDFEVALAVGALLIILSAIVLLSIKLLPSWTRFGLTSPLPSARSGLS